MPAPKSILNKRENSFAPVDKAKILYTTVLKAALKMPKRYQELILKDMVHEAANVMSNTKAANSVPASGSDEQRLRIKFWVVARARLQALSSFIDQCIELPSTVQYYNNNGDKKGITENELQQISDLIEEEQRLLTKTIKSERSKINNSL